MVIFDWPLPGNDWLKSVRTGGSRWADPSALNLSPYLKVDYNAEIATRDWSTRVPGHLYRVVVLTTVPTVPHNFGSETKDHMNAEGVG